MLPIKTIKFLKCFDFSIHFGVTCYRLHIESEKLFVDVIEVLAAAMHWEKRATCLLAQEADLSEFEDVIRFVVLSLLFM